jgi:hypothetical protein
LYAARATISATTAIVRRVFREMGAGFCSTARILFKGSRTVYRGLNKNRREYSEGIPEIFRSPSRSRNSRLTTADMIELHRGRY